MSIYNNFYKQKFMSLYNDLVDHDTRFNSFLLCPHCKYKNQPDELAVPIEELLDASTFGTLLNYECDSCENEFSYNPNIKLTFSTYPNIETILYRNPFSKIIEIVESSTNDIELQNETYKKAFNESDIIEEVEINNIVYQIILFDKSENGESGYDYTLYVYPNGLQNDYGQQQNEPYNPHYECEKYDTLLAVKTDIVKRAGEILKMKQKL